MRKTLTALAPLALVAGLLTGCGGGDEDSAYCKDLKANKAQFEAMADGDIGKLEDAFAAMHKLADEAPDSVADDWKTVDEGVTAMTDALDEAGVSLDDLAKIQAGEIPDGVDMSAVQKLGPELEKFGGEEMTKASEAIDKHAADECGVTLAQG